jgi:ketosteroid isomerase-like protein
MTPTNLEVFERGLDAYNRRDIDDLLEVLDPEVEWYPVLEVLLGGQGTVYRGHDGVRELFRNIADALGEIRGEVSEVVEDSRDRIVASGQLYARGRHSGAVTEASLGWLVNFRNGKVSKIRTYGGIEEALEVAAQEG